jgi:hypothetical protein
MIKIKSLLKEDKSKRDFIVMIKDLVKRKLITQDIANHILSLFEHSIDEAYRDGATNGFSR